MTLTSPWLKGTSYENKMVILNGQVPRFVKTLNIFDS